MGLRRLSAPPLFRRGGLPFVRTQALLRVYGNLPVVYAGGVMSNSLLRRELEAAYNGTFAPPAYSADNAAGIALLCSLREKGAGRL